MTYPIDTDGEERAGVQSQICLTPKTAICHLAAQPTEGAIGLRPPSRAFCDHGFSSERKYLLPATMYP